MIWGFVFLVAVFVSGADDFIVIYELGCLRYGKRFTMVWVSA